MTPALFAAPSRPWSDSDAPLSKTNRWRKAAVFAGLAAGLLLVMSGCDDTDTDGNADGGGPTATADNYVIKNGTPGTPVDINGVIEISDHMGFSTNINKIYTLNLTEEEPPRVIDGRQEVEPGYTRSRKLRIERVMEPDGGKLVQVDVSLTTPLALKSLRGVSKGDFIPGPLLQDTIGNSYWASGYIVDSPGATTKTLVHIDRSRQFKNLNELPRLSRNKPQTMRLLFFVNQGVTIESFSYGGDEPKYTFDLEITDR